MSVRVTLPIFAVAALGTAVACNFNPGPEPAGQHQAVVGGTIAENDPAVIALHSGSWLICTGTLVSPAVVLTAAHCIDDFSTDPDATVFFGFDVSTDDGVRIGVKKAQQHLGWTGNLGDGHDIGLMLLNFAPADDVATPVPLNTADIAGHIDDPYRVVGFGVYDRDTGDSDGRKREGLTTISGAHADVLETGDMDISICFGDSGGPGFLTVDDTEYVAGVHSYTMGDDCLPPQGDTRVDQYVESFILPWIQQNDPVCAEDGKCARIGCSADPDCLPCGADGTCTAACPLPDPDCPTSDMGEICQADTQCTTGLCIPWSGDWSSKFCSRACDLASADCPSGLSCQIINPFGPVCYYDDDPDGVVGDDCDVATDCGSYLCQESECVTECDLSQGIFCPEDFECSSTNDVDYYCHSVGGGGGGCRVGADSNPPTLMALMLFALLWWRRRR